MSRTTNSIILVALPALLLGCGNSSGCDDVESGLVNAITIECDDSVCLMNVNTTLSDLDGQPVQEGLSPEDFEITSVRLVDDADIIDVESARVIGLSFEVVDSERLSTAVLLDQSGSMDDNDPSGLRFDAALSLSDSLLGSGGDDEVAVASFPPSYSAPMSLYQTSIWQTFTSDNSEVQSAVELMRGSYLAGYTPLYTSIAETCEWMNSELASENTVRALVVMTDGKDSTDPELARQAAIDNDVRLYIVGLGDNIAQDELYPLAEATGGLYLPADADQLTEVFQNLSGALFGSVQIEVELTFAPGADLPQAGRTYTVEGTLIYKGDLEMDFSSQTYIGDSSN